jgi:hypothetical protein
LAFIPVDIHTSMLLSRALLPPIWHGLNLKMPGSPTVVTRYELTMVRSNLFSTRPHKCFGMTFAC